MPTTSLRDALRQAEGELGSGGPNEALRRCEQILGKYPRWLEALRVRAEALIALNRFDEAERVLDGVLACHPEHVRAFWDRAYLAQRRGNLPGALACYRRACELTAQNGQLRTIHNQLAAQLGRPAYTPSHTGLARLYLRSELFPQALREWDSALHTNPARLDAQIGMAETFWRMGDARHAQSVCRYTLQHMPYCLKPMLLLALFELDAQHDDEARTLIQTAAELDPEQNVARELFADLIATGHTALAQLFRQHARSLTTPLPPDSGPFAGQTGVNARVNPNRPITTPLPAGQLSTGPLFPTTILAAGESSPTGKLERPIAPPAANGQGERDGKMEDFFSKSRASVVPADFQRVFKETEYMLWSRDDEPKTAEIAALNGNQSVPGEVATPPPATPPGSPTPTMEPAPASIDGDTFVHWLQSQGARAIDDAPVFASREPDYAPPQPSVPEQAGMPAFLAQAYREAEEIGAPPNPAAPTPVESMFAPPPEPPYPDPPYHAEPALPTPVFTPETSLPAPRATYDIPTIDPIPVVRAEPADIAEPETAELAAYTPAALGGDPPDRSEAMAASEPPIYTGTFDDLPPPAAPFVPSPAIENTLPAQYEEPLSLPNIDPAMLGLSSPNASMATQYDTHDIAAPANESHSAFDEATSTDAPITIEAIEQGLESAGFARLDTGRLGSVATTLDAAPIEPNAAEKGNTTRLEEARALRRQGRMGEALNEYRILVKAAIDEIPAIIRDLRDAAIEDPQEPEIYRLLGDAHIRLGDYVEALEAYNRGNALRQEHGS